MGLHRWLLIGILTIPFSSIAVAVSFADEVSAAATESAEEEAKPLMGQSEALDWALPVALILAATHFAAPTLRKFIEPNEARISSLGGGMAAAYVFIHLLAELDKGHELVGDRIHLFVLFGFLSYYGVEHFLSHAKRNNRLAERSRLEFSIQIAIGWVYSWLIMYSMPESIQETGLRIVPPLVALVLHLIYSDFHLGKEFPSQFDRWGRIALASAPIVGWAGDVIYFQDNPAVSDLLVALLAGAVIYKLFKYELPEHRQSSFVWFLLGVIAFLALDLASE